MTNGAKILLYVLASIILISAGYIWYLKKDLNKQELCCKEKQTQAANLIINNERLDSLLKVKDTVFLQVIEKAKNLKNESNKLHQMVIITNPDSLSKSLTRLTDNYKQNK